MYKNKIKEKLNKIAANHIELNHRPALITMEKANQSLLFRPQRKKLSLSKDLSSSSALRHNQSTDEILREEDSRSCKKQFMKVFSNSCSKELQKVQSTTLRLNHNPSSAYLSKRINSQQIHLPEKLTFFGHEANNQNANKISVPLSTTGSKQKIIPVLIQAVSCNIKHANSSNDHDSKYRMHVQRTQSVYTVDNEVRKINIDVFETPIRHFKTCYDEEQATFRKDESKTTPAKNSFFQQENTSLKKTSRFVSGEQLETSKGLQKAKILPNTENLCKQNIFLAHSNRYVSPKYQNQHRIEQSPTPVLRGSTEASQQYKQTNRPLPSEQLLSSKAAIKYLPISKQIEKVQEQRKEIESRISKKLDQLSQRASQIAKMCNSDREKQLEQHKKPKVLVSSSTKNIRHPVKMEPSYSKQPASATVTNSSSQFASRKASRQVSNFLLSSANGSLRHQILNRIYS